MTSDIKIFISAFFLSAFAGLASLFRVADPITLRSVLSYTLNSGTMGLGIALLWYNKYVDDLAFLVGLCIVCGLTGVKGVDIILGWGQKLAKRFLNIEDDKPTEEKK